MAILGVQLERADLSHTPSPVADLKPGEEISVAEAGQHQVRHEAWDKRCGEISGMDGHHLACRPAMQETKTETDLSVKQVQDIVSAIRPREVG